MNNQPKSLKRLIYAAITGLIICAAIFGAPRLGRFLVNDAADITLTGSTPEAVSTSKLVGEAPREKTMEIVVSLKTRNEAELEALIERQSDPDSPDFLAYLTVDEYVARFAPTASDVDIIAKYLRSNGIVIKGVPANRAFVHAQGTVSQLERAFRVQINKYTDDASGKPVSYLSNDRDPSVPAHLRDIVQAVVGLSTLDGFESRVRESINAEPRGPAAARQQAALTPKDVAEVYNLPNVNNRKSKRRATGSGVTMAIVTAEGYDRKDVETYWKHHGVERTGALIDIPVNGSSGATNNETTLDLELMGAQVPGADIHMYMAYDAKFVNFILAFNRMTVENKADVMSVSWGLCERRTGWLIISSQNSIFRQAAAQGIALFASSGDDGVYDCKQKSTRWEVDFPSSSPYVTAVGGTTLAAANGRRRAEIAWSGSGGGVSDKFDRPKWQASGQNGLPANEKRLSADISMVADPNTGYSLLYKGNWSKIGGTSASAPTWAALWGLTVEARGRRLGLPNPHIYRIGRGAHYDHIFYDVVRGMNGAGRGKGYKAAPGYDHATGWGAPNGEALLEHLRRATPTKR